MKLDQIGGYCDESGESQGPGYGSSSRDTEVETQSKLLRDKNPQNFSIGRMGMVRKGMQLRTTHISASALSSGGVLHQIRMYWKRRGLGEETLSVCKS